MTTVPERLYHFTCAHSQKRIGTSHCLLIAQIVHPLLGCKVIWLTSESEPDREQTGLGNNTGLTTCDRMAFRYVVTDVARCYPWLESTERQRAPALLVEALEAFSDPEHWWITGAVGATFDRTWVRRKQATA